MNAYYIVFVCNQNPQKALNISSIMAQYKLHFNPDNKYSTKQNMKDFLTKKIYLMLLVQWKIF